MTPPRHWRSYIDAPLPTPAEALIEPFAAFPSWFLRIECDRCGKVRMLNGAHVTAGQRNMPLRDFLARAPWNCTAASRAATAASWCGGSCCAAGDPQKKSPGSETGSRGLQFTPFAQVRGLPLAHTDTGDRAARPYSPRARPTPVTIGNAGCLCPVHRVTAQRRVRRIALRADSARPEQGSQIGLVTTRGDEAAAADRGHQEGEVAPAPRLGSTLGCACGRVRMKQRPEPSERG